MKQNGPTSPISGIESAQFKTAAPSRSTFRGQILMLGSALTFAFLTLLIKILGPEFRVWDIAMFRFIGSIALMFIMFGRTMKPFQSPSIKMLIIRGISGTGAFLAMLTSVRMIPMSTAMVFFYTFPAFAALFSPLFFKDRISRPELLLVLTALCGVGVLFDFRMEGSFFGQFMGLIGGMCAGLTVSLIKKLSANNGAPEIYFYFCFLGAIIIFPPFISNPNMPATMQDWLIVGGIILSSTAAQLLMNKGFRYCKSWEGGLIMTSELIFVAILGILVLGEVMTWRLWVGGGMILASAIAIDLIKRKTGAVNRLLVMRRKREPNTL